MREDLARMGATPEQLAQIEQQEESHEPQPFEVLPRNWLAMQVFLDCAGQWLRDAAGTPVALPRPAVHSTLQMWPVPGKQRSDTFHRIRVLEGVAAQEFQRRAKRG